MKDEYKKHGRLSIPSKHISIRKMKFDISFRMFSISIFTILLIVIGPILTYVYESSLLMLIPYVITNIILLCTSYLYSYANVGMVLPHYEELYNDQYITDRDKNYNIIEAYVNYCVNAPITTFVITGVISLCVFVLCMTISMSIATASLLQITPIGLYHLIHFINHKHHTSDIIKITKQFKTR